MSTGRVTEVDNAPRVVIEHVVPEVDCGRFGIKRAVGEQVVVEADIFADGHDVLAAVLLYRRDEARQWTEAPMTLFDNDRWRGEFTVSEPGRYRYTLQGWVDRFASWARDLSRRVEAGQDVAVELEIGAALVRAAVRRAAHPDAAGLGEHANVVGRGGEAGVRLALSEELAGLMARYPDRERAATYDKPLLVQVDRERARFGAWYEMFPRSCAPVPGRHATFADVEARLPYVASMGFDVLYLPPIHPIARTLRKGKNNAETTAPGDPGSPWAIGASEGGHKAVHPDLGTLADFERLVASARRHGLEIALDLAFQCSPDHPYVTEHPEWFRRRPDGTVQYAENPPKKYQDIYPFDFETAGWRPLWEELRSIVRFWIDRDVRIFRVDNPHTKPFAFWEWLFGETHREHPDVIFLAEAFTRPKVMYRLAKLGFTQSYTYFTWRNTRAELESYLTELTATPVREYFRPNFFANTPDILHAYLQDGGRPAFVARLVLAATLAANYGIYGPPFELCERRPAAPGSEEYLDSEKYQLVHWDFDRPDSLKDLIARVNGIRHEHPALSGDWSLRFHGMDNPNLICYSKTAPAHADVVLVVVNLDPHRAQRGWTALDLPALGLRPEEPYVVRDLLSGAQFRWQGARNYIELAPEPLPAHIFHVTPGGTP
ncbi:MAG TPA: alpha-1,4-glucan--maltose-1-phosphate maltosyltransferase [bacterium]|nr:alpha-1,4-glucan--maltose-1-phosphate maltosyltransferase [bacterium]